MRRRARDAEGVRAGAPSPASVAISFQFGSREDTSRAKVHTSLVSITLSGLPSTTSPALSFVAVINLECIRIVACAVAPRSSTSSTLALSIDTKVVSTFWPALSRCAMAAEKNSNTSFASSGFSALRSPAAKAVMIIS